ncbi:MAG: phosphatidate cytidylyltransferase, partial [Bryobacteraceae bacterium]
MKRVLTALALIPFAIYAIFFAPPWFFLLSAVAMALLCYLEYSNIVAAYGIEPPGIAGAVAGLTLLFDIAYIRLVALAALMLSLRLRDLANGIASAAAMTLGAVYIFGAWRCAIDLRAIHPNWLLFALAINWVGDVAAYYTGRAIGKHKLAPRVSPGKTVEGAIGSLFSGALFGAAFATWWPSGFSLAVWIPLALVTNAAGQCGDLVESALKRGAGMKDSGTLLPGHGGWLDRLDSSLFTLPVVYCSLL